ncbi:MAG: 23S rRNA (pseudouridine(1915)-N(3))-methyltransferase RlmH [Bacteroidia bacterium]|nr:23S rRNA (pseudouridine(1915)-N(3))-methyltransferase RlmH [Bacteroidia bacterium]
MKIELWYIGKNAFPFVEDGMKIFEKRIKRYNPFEIVCIQDVKSGKKIESKTIMANEARKILTKLTKDDFVIILDENGKIYGSKSFSEQVNTWLQISKKRLIFLVGGAFGFDQSIYDRSNVQLSLSKMTFSHQLIRLIFLEQLYRGFTILRNEKYHNE